MSVIHTHDINIDEFTRNVQIEESNSYYPVTGEGIFDTLMETATKHLLAQFKANRIRKEDYADAYAHIYEVTLQAAMQIWLQKPEQLAKVDMIDAQIEHENAKKLNTEADTALKGAQKEYIEKQADAAEKDIDLKQAQIDSENMKANLYKRQIEGFDEDFKQKLLKISLDSWAVAFSVAQDVIASDVNMIPKAIKTRTLDSLWDGAIAPDVDMNNYDSRNVTTTSSPELLAQEPDYKSYQDNYNG